MKRCPGCKEILSLDSFGKHRGSKDGLATYCRECYRQRNRESLAKNGGPRRYHLRKRYGLEPTDIERVIQLQKGLCPICRERPAAHVDHDHVTGILRGVVCPQCNRALGIFSDNPEWMEAAAAYLRNPPKLEDAG